MEKQILLENFIRVTEFKNLETISTLFDISVATIKQRLNTLEKLFAHSLYQLHPNNRVTMTTQGQALAALATAYQNTPEKVSASLRIGMPTDYISLYLNSVFMTFIAHFTELTLQIDTDVSGNLLQRLNKGAFDLIFATHWLNLPQAVPLYERRFFWVAAKNSKWLSQTQLPIALYPENCPIRTQVFAQQSLQGTPLSIVLSTPSPQALCEAVLTDIAIAPIAEFRIDAQMQILDPQRYNLPQLPVFNESLYFSDTIAPKTQHLFQALALANCHHL